MRELAVAVVVIALAAGAASASAPPVAWPRGVELGWIATGETRTFRFRIDNPPAGKAIKKLTCTGAGMTITPRKVDLAVGASATFTAAYKGPRIKLSSKHVDATIKCGKAKVKVHVIVVPKRKPAPTTVEALADEIVDTAGGWAGDAFSLGEKRITSVSCGSPMDGDEDTCCVVSLDDLEDRSIASYPIRADGCARPTARTPAVLRAELAALFEQGDYVAVEAATFWGGMDATLLVDGRMVSWTVGALFIDDQRASDWGDQPPVVVLASPGGGPILVYSARRGDGAAPLIVSPP